MKYPNMTWGTMEAIVNKLGGEEDAKAFLRGITEVVRIKTIDYIGTVTISATTEKLVAKDKFVKDSEEFEFRGISEYFTDWFLADNGKIEDPIDSQELRYGNLTKESVHSLIITELGGEAKAETTLTEMFALLKKQANREEGDLLTNRHLNIFYIKDVTAVLRAVCVDWDNGGWSVYAFSVAVDNTFDWPAGSRVFSRNS